MATSLPIGAERAVPASRGMRLLLYVLCGSLALYPLLEKFIAPVLGVAFAVAASSVALQLIRRDFRLPRTYLAWVWGIYAVLYVVWSCIGLLHDNNPAYVRGDSQGFLLYIGAMPVLFLFIAYGRLEAAFAQFLVDCSKLIAFISIAAVGGYFIVFGPLDADSLLLLNAFLGSIGLSWQLDNNSGLLGVYTYTGHLLLLGIAIVLYRYSVQHRRAHVFLLGLFLVGIVLDGHRALVVSAILQVAIVGIRLFREANPRKKLVLGIVLVVIPAIAIVMSMDWIVTRFDFSTADPSTAERWAQIPALLDKIEQSPVLGSGFGTVAAYIRSLERPYSYEVDFLATAMKLGLVGCLLYFGTYVAALAHGALACGRAGLYLLSAGLPFLFYMGTNGGQAMSTDSAVFHIFLFLLIDAVQRRRAAPVAADVLAGQP